MTFFWTTKHRLDVMNEEIKKMAEKARELEHSGKYDREEAINKVVRIYLDRQNDNISYSITKNIINKIKNEVTKYLNTINERGEKDE